MTGPLGKYDEALTAILVNEKSIIGFLSTIFNFLARRTDFYYIPKGDYENMGFPPGVAEELVVKVLRKCNPNKSHNKQPTDINDEIMCSTVAQNVEVVADEDIEGSKLINNPKIVETETVFDHTTESAAQNLQKNETVLDYTTESAAQNLQKNNLMPKLDYSEALKNNPPPIIPTQRNSETFNGAEREKYCWSQTISDLDVTVTLPPNVKCSKDLKVTINPSDMCVSCSNGDMIFKDTLPFKIKSFDSFWSISEEKLLIHLEKVQERWWSKLLSSEEDIDLSKIDCSRSLYDLPEDHIAKVQELQWNQEQKMRGLPTTDQLKNIEVLKKAWNADGSPFKGQKFDPNVLKPQ